MSRHVCYAEPRHNQVCGPCRPLELDPPATVHVYTGVDDLEALDDFLAHRRPYLAVDTETTGLGWGDTVRTVQFGDDVEAWVIPVRHLGVIRRVLDRTPWLIAWNAGFDASHLARLLGLPFDELVVRFLDTATLAGIHDPRAAYQGGVGRGLKDWAAHVCGPVAASFEAERKTLFRSAKATWATVDPLHPVMVRYAGSDPVLTYRVHRHLVPLVTPRADIVRREQRLMRIITRMRHRGIALDLERAEVVRVGYRLEFAETMATLADGGITSVFKNLEVAAAIEEEGYGSLLTKRTVKGATSVAKDVLKVCAAGGSELAALVRRAKQLKRFGDYAETFAAAAAHDGRVHASIRPIGAKTRRMSVSQPQLQQVPKDERALRSMFSPPDGLLIVRADYSSMELRYMAHVSGDAQLIGDIEEGAAIFESLGEHVFGEPADDAEAKWQRGTAKTAVYAMSYGSGIRRTAEIIGRPEHEAEALRRAWWGRYANLKRTFYDARDEVERAGGVELPATGWLPSDPQRPHVGLNLLVQGGCRDAFAERILALDDAGLGDNLVLPIHDEQVVEVDRANAPEAIELLRTIMPITDVRVPIPIAASAGRSWGEAYEPGAESYSLEDPASIDDEVDEGDEAGG